MWLSALESMEFGMFNAADDQAVETADDEPEDTDAIIEVLSLLDPLHSD